MWTIVGYSPGFEVCHENSKPLVVRATSVRVRTTSLSAGISASAGSIRPSMGSAIGNVRSAAASSRLTSSVPAVPVVSAS